MRFSDLKLNKKQKLMFFSKQKAARKLIEGQEQNNAHIVSQDFTENKVFEKYIIGVQVYLIEYRFEEYNDEVTYFKYKIIE